MTATITTKMKRKKIQPVLDKKYANIEYSPECNIIITFEGSDSTPFATGDIEDYRKEPTRNERIRNGIKKNKTTFDNLSIPQK